MAAVISEGCDSLISNVYRAIVPFVSTLMIAIVTDSTRS